MSEEQYHSASHCKYLTQYHIIWCPKFRFSVLQKGADDKLKTSLLTSAINIDMKSKHWKRCQTIYIYSWIARRQLLPVI